MKSFSLLATLAMISSFNAFAQYHNDIEPIKGARNDAKGLIKSFQLQNMNLESGAPEYTKIYNEMFVPAIKVESDKLEQSLDAINQALSKDYSLIMSLKGKPQTTALKATIKIAEERLASAADGMLNDYYHKPIKSVVTLNNSFSKIVSKCLTVLCVNQVKEDFVRWIKISSSINKKLDLETTSMDKVPNFSTFTKNALKANSDEAIEVGNHLAVSMTKEEYEDILAAERKVIEEARIKAEQEAAAKAAEEAARAKAEAEAASNPKIESYGCDGRQADVTGVVICHRPYVLRDIGQVGLAASSYSPEKHSVICASIGLKSDKEIIPLSYDYTGNNIDRFAIKSVTCVDPQGNNHKKRATYESKMLLESGFTLITKPNYQFNDRRVDGIEVKNSDKNNICRFYGFNQAVNPSNWEQVDSPGRNFIVVTASEIKASNGVAVWSKITCK